MITQDVKAWREGFKAGKDAHGQCPYPAGSREAWSWYSGHVEGKATLGSESLLAASMICWIDGFPHQQPFSAGSERHRLQCREV